MGFVASEDVPEIRTARRLATAAKSLPKPASGSPIMYLHRVLEERF